MCACDHQLALGVCVCVCVTVRLLRTFALCACVARAELPEKMSLSLYTYIHTVWRAQSCSRRCLRCCRVRSRWWPTRSGSTTSGSSEAHHRRIYLRWVPLCGTRVRSSIPFREARRCHIYTQYICLYTQPVVLPRHRERQGRLGVHRRQM